MQIRFSDVSIPLVPPLKPVMLLILDLQARGLSRERGASQRTYGVDHARQHLCSSQQFSRRV